MHFGENQLSPSSLGMSPLPTAPLTVLQHGTVRASTPCYWRFTLAMGSSLGFGSAPCHLRPPKRSRRPVQTRFRCGTVPQALHHSHTEQLAGSFFNRHAIRAWATPKSGPLSPLTAHQQTIAGSISLPSPGFFSPFPHGTVRYRSMEALSLGTWASQLPTRFLVSGGTHATSAESGGFAYGALT